MDTSLKKRLPSQFRYLRAAPPQKLQSFPFLRLPPEIRNQVYGWIYTDFPGQVLKEPRPKIQLLQTCHQIHDEAIWILCRTNRFSVTNSAPTTMPERLKPRLPIIPQASALRILPIIRHVLLHIDLRSVQEAYLEERSFCAPKFRKERYLFTRNLRLLCMALGNNRCTILETVKIAFRNLRYLRLGHIDEGNGEFDPLAPFKELRVRSLKISVFAREHVDNRTRKYFQDVIDTVEGRGQSIEHRALTTFYLDFKIYVQALCKFSRAMELHPNLKDFSFTEHVFDLLRPLRESVSLLSAVSKIDIEQCFARLEEIYSWQPLSIYEGSDLWQEVLRRREWLLMRTEFRQLVGLSKLPELEHGWLVLKHRFPVQKEEEERNPKFHDFVSKVGIIFDGLGFKARMKIVSVVVLLVVCLLCALTRLVEWASPRLSIRPQMVGSEGHCIWQGTSREDIPTREIWHSLMVVGKYIRGDWEWKHLQEVANAGRTTLLNIQGSYHRDSDVIG